MGTATWHPKWWTKDNHGSAWDNVKEAMRRDWEQTKADVGAGGSHLDQDVDDTVKQAVGKDVIPPPGIANAPGGTPRGRSWDDDEHPLAYGYNARSQYGKQHDSWTDDLEAKLKTEWDQAGATVSRKWSEVKGLVRRGYERAKS